MERQKFIILGDGCHSEDGWYHKQEKQNITKTWSFLDNQIAMMHVQAQWIEGVNSVLFPDYPGGGIPPAVMLQVTDSFACAFLLKLSPFTKAQKLLHNVFTSNSLINQIQKMLLVVLKSAD